MFLSLAAKSVVKAVLTIIAIAYLASLKNFKQSKNLSTNFDLIL